MSNNREKVDQRLVPLDIDMPVPIETEELVESVAAQAHTVIVEGVYGPEEVEVDTGSIRR